MTYVPNETYIPQNTRIEMQAELQKRFNSYLSDLDDHQISILNKSEKDFRSFVADIFVSVAALFGYIVGTVIGTVQELIGAAQTGWDKGYKSAINKNRRFY